MFYFKQISENILRQIFCHGNILIKHPFVDVSNAGVKYTFPEWNEHYRITCTVYDSVEILNWWAIIDALLENTL